MIKRVALKKGKEGEQIVTNILNVNPPFHYLINNLVLLGDNGVSHQIDHIYIRDNGVFVIETKNYFGEIKGGEDDSFWTHSYTSRKKKITTTFHNPLKQNKSHVRAIKHVIGKDIPIYCFVVFTQNNEQEINLFNVVNPSLLLDRINLMSSEKPLTKEDMKNINDTLLSNEADINDEQHIENVKALNKSRKETQKTLREAIEKKICPKCQGKLIVDKDGLKCSQCENRIKL